MVSLLPPSFVLSSGNEWAKRSMSLVLADLNQISVEKLEVLRSLPALGRNGI